jgi:hypothetical protein
MAVLFNGYRKNEVSAAFNRGSCGAMPWIGRRYLRTSNIGKFFHIAIATWSLPERQSPQDPADVHSTTMLTNKLHSGGTTLQTQAYKEDIGDDAPGPHSWTGGWVNRVQVKRFTAGFDLLYHFGESV